MKVIEAVLSGIELWQVASFFITGAIAWCTTVYFQARKLIRTVKKTENKLAAICDKVEEMAATVKKELTWNSGLSSKDMIATIGASLGKMEAWNTAILNQSGIAAWRSDSCGDMDWVNAAFTHHTGYGLEGLRGCLWLNLVCEEDRQRVEGQWLRCLERCSPFTTTFSLAPGDSNSETVLMQAQPFFSSQKQGGNLLGYAGTLQMVGDNK